MLKKFMTFKLSTQLNISFYTLLILLTIVAMSGYLGLKQGQGDFVKYRGLAIDTNLAGRLQANMLMTRLNVLKYINDDSADILQNYRERVEKMNVFLTTAKKQIQSPNRALKVAESSKLVDKYEAGFEKVVALIAKRHKVVKEELDPSGLSMRETMTDILEYTHGVGNIESTYRAAKAQEALLLGRLYVVKFLVSNSKNDYQRAKVELEINIKDDLAALENSLQSDRSRTLMQEFTQFRDQYLLALNQVYSIINNRNDIIDNTLNKIGPTVANNIEQVKLSVKAEQEELGPMAQNNAQEAVIIVGVIALFSIAMGIAAAYFSARIIRQPIGGEPIEIASISETISKGDLSHKFENQNMATGIFRSIINMSSNLRELISGIVETGNSITHAANDSANVAKENSKLVIAQKERTSQVATAIEEMSYSIQEMVNLSKQSAQSAQEAQSQAQKGKLIVETTVASINSLASRVEISVEMIKALEQNSHDIGSVIEVIKNISEQTNLLALNAAIEAARAGEQGRGFAVVADEVRTLAQRTKESTSEIQNTVNALQIGTQNAVQSMEESGREALETVQQSSATGEALDNILRTINAITDMNSQVATAVNEQSSVTTDISTNITAISEYSEVAAEAANNAATTADDMTQLAINLQHSVQGFKLA